MTQVDVHPCAAAWAPDTRWTARVVSAGSGEPLRIETVTETRGVATKFRLRGRIQKSQNHLPSNSDFSSDFAHFNLEILRNLKILVYIQNFFL